MAQVVEDEGPQILAFLDVLGFGSMYQRLGHQGTLTLYKALLSFIDSQEGGLDAVPVPDGHVAVGWFLPEHAYFSDTVLFWTHYDPIRLFRMTELAAEAVCKALEIGLPLRGAISIGEGTFNSGRRIFMGAALNEAARTEKTQVWLGVSFGPSILTAEFGRDLYLHTVLPFKSHAKSEAEQAVPGLVVDWPRRWRETRQTDPREAIRRLDVKREAAEYYATTLRFVTFSEENHDWFRRSSHLEFG